MKTIKKLALNILDKSKMSEIYGLGSITDYTSCMIPCAHIGLPHYIRPVVKEIKKPSQQCGCGCAGCNHDDGSAGFTLGMMNAGLEGMHCSFFALI